MGLDPGPVWERIKDVVVKTIIRFDGRGGRGGEGGERRGGGGRRGRVNCSIVICQTTNRNTDHMIVLLPHTHTVMDGLITIILINNYN